MQTTRPRAEQLASEHERLNLGCGEDYRDGWCNVDAIAAVDPDYQLNLNEQPWPFPDGSFEYVLCSHVLEHLDDLEMALGECARILKPGGYLKVHHPIGLDMQADADHNKQHEWDWETPKMLCGKRHWDHDCGLAVVGRDVNLWAQKPGIWGALQQHRINYWLARYGPGRWCFDLEATSGEFIVEFRRDPA